MYVYNYRLTYPTPSIPTVSSYTTLSFNSAYISSPPLLCQALNNKTRSFLFNKFLNMSSYQDLFNILDGYVEQRKTPSRNVRDQLSFEPDAATQNLPCYEMNSFESLIDDQLSNSSSAAHHEPSTSVHNIPSIIASCTPPAIACISSLSMLSNTSNTILYTTARSIPCTPLHSITYYTSSILSTTPSAVSQIPKRKKMPILKKITHQQFKRYRIQFTENQLIRLFKRFSLNTAIVTSD